MLKKDDRPCPLQRSRPLVLSRQRDEAPPAKRSFSPWVLKSRPWTRPDRMRPLAVSSASGALTGPRARSPRRRQQPVLLLSRFTNARLDAADRPAQGRRTQNWLEGRPHPHQRLLDLPDLCAELGASTGHGRQINFYPENFPASGRVNCQKTPPSGSGDCSTSSDERGDAFGNTTVFKPLHRDRFRPFGGGAGDLPGGGPSSAFFWPTASPPARCSPFPTASPSAW